MVQFIKFPNKLSSESLSLQALWTTAAGFLTYPDYSGSLRPKLEAYIPKGTPFVPLYKELRSKYLKTIMIHAGHNRFDVRYELYSSPRTDIPHTRYLTVAESKNYMKKYKSHYVEQDGNFTAVPVSVIKDTNLTLKAKGLYIAIKRLFDLSDNIDDDITISKAELLKRENLKATSIKYGWNELKDKGYLHQRRYFEPSTGLFAWGYQLYETPQIHKYVERLKPANIKERKMLEADKGAKAVAETPTEISVIEDTIKQNIEYDVLIANAGIHEIHYTTEFIDGVVALALETVCSTRKSYKIQNDYVTADIMRHRMMSLTSEDVIDVADIFSNNSKPIKNKKAYLLACLFNAPINRAIF